MHAALPQLGNPVVLPQLMNLCVPFYDTQPGGVQTHGNGNTASSDNDSGYVPALRTFNIPDP